jgi:thioesterase domain-containing protein
MPPDHQALARALYDAIFDYTPADQYTGNVVVYEATSEPARSSERVAKKWARISTDADIVPVKGTHMSIVRSPDGLPLARDLCKRLQHLEFPQ